MGYTQDGESGTDVEKCYSTGGEDDDDDDDEYYPNQSPPDGGWGWLVVIASFICNMIVDGVCFSFGIVSPEFQKTFGVNHEKVGWVGSSLAGCYLLVGMYAIRPK